ncbi:MAG: hypothetical protein WD690_00345 [Vicinamibacterales bacterium]
MKPQLLPPPRPATADLLYLVKERALDNLRHSSLEDFLFVVAVLGLALTALLFINEVLLGRALRVKRLTIPSFFVLMYLALMSLPSIVWFYASPNDPIRYTYFASMQSVLVMFPLGVMFANAMFGRLSNPPQVARFFTVPLEKTADDRYALRYWLLMIVMAMAVTTAYLTTSSYVPLIGAVTSYGEADVSMVRRAIVAEGVTIHYGHALTARLLLPFCLVYAYYMAHLYGGRWRLLFWPTLGFVAFVSSLTFDRMFPFSVLLFLVLAVYFKHDDLALRAAANGGRSRRGLSTARLGFYVVALLLVGMLVGGIVSLTQFNKPMDLEIIRVTATDFLFNRVVLDPSYMAYLYYEEINEPSKFLYGKALHVVVSRALGVEFYPLISPSFVASLWTNFGWFGVLFGSALIGFVLQFIQVSVFDRKTIPALTCYIILLLNGAWIIYGHLMATMVFSVYAPSILILMHLKRRRKAAARAAARAAKRLERVRPHPPQVAAHPP